MLNDYPGVNDAAGELTELRTRVARLEAALEAERRERAALPAMLVPHAAQLKQQLAALEKTFELTRDSADERMGQLASADQDVAQGTARGTVEALRPLLERMLGTLEAQMTINTALASSLEALCDRVEAIEKLLQPALEGKAKLVAQGV
jgi:hypothetical protein